MLNEKLLQQSQIIEQEIEQEFKKIDKICEANTIKVLEAFQENNLSEMHFGGTTGYGYGDIGRDTIEKIFSKIFKTQDSLVRTQFVSGTHAISVLLFGILRPNDTFISINGKPYDTLDEVIGIKENSSSLKSFGVNFEQIDLKNGEFDTKQIIEAIKNKSPKLICIQRSRGYETRNSLSLESISNIITEIKNVSNNPPYIMVDNCYGEFVDVLEPTELGADVIVGSLIKNLGGGLAPTRCIYIWKKRTSRIGCGKAYISGTGKRSRQ